MGRKGKHSIYFSHDSGYFKDFKTIGDNYGPFDVCLLGCGQYDVLWEDILMRPEETVQAHLDLNGKLLSPIHWCAFTLATHNWDDPILRLESACMKNNLHLATPKIVEKRRIGKKQKFTNWWGKVN